MTAKEQRYVRKLEIRVAELERHFDIANKSSAENFVALFETRIALKQAFEALEECAVIMHDCIKADPQYMAMQKRLHLEADF